MRYLERRGRGKGGLTFSITRQFIPIPRTSSTSVREFYFLSRRDKETSTTEFSFLLVFHLFYLAGVHDSLFDFDRSEVSGGGRERGERKEERRTAIVTKVIITTTATAILPYYPTKD